MLDKGGYPQESRGCVIVQFYNEFWSIASAALNSTYF